MRGTAGRRASRVFRIQHNCRQRQRPYLVGSDGEGRRTGGGAGREDLDGDGRRARVGAGRSLGKASDGDGAEGPRRRWLGRTRTDGAAVGAAERGGEASNGDGAQRARRS